MTVEARVATLAETRESKQFWAHYRLLVRVLSIQEAVTWSLRGVALGLLGVCAWLLARRFVPLPAIYPPYFLAPPAALAVLLALAALVRRRSPAKVLRRADRRLRLQERLITALEVQSWPASHPQGRAQLRDAVLQFTRREPLDEFPLRLGAREVVAVVALALLAVGLAVLPNPVDARQQRQEQARQAANAEAERLDRVLAELEAQPAATEEVERAKEALAEAARLLRQSQLSPEQQRAALAALEQRLARLQGGDADRIEEALAALAASLAAESQTRDLAAALARGDGAQAAEELRRLAENARNLPEPERRRLGQALRSAAAAASRAAPGLGQQLDESGRALEQGGDAGSELDQAAREVESAARQLEGQNALERALSALQNSRGALGEPTGQQRGSTRSGRGEPREAPGGDGQGESGDRGGDGPSSEGEGEGGSRPGTGSANRSDQVYDPLFSPSREELVPSQSEFQPDEVTIDPNERAALGNEAQVGYADVYPQYERRAAQALESSYIPVGMKDLVRDYFQSLAPNR